MHRHVLLTLSCSLLLTLACSQPEEFDPFATLTASPTTVTFTAGPDDTTGDGDPTGDGDGDGDPTGDGDGDPTGDGDGDPTGDGDGDGDPTGDGDGDLPPNCGWNAGGMPAGYYCGFMGADPNGIEPISCPGGLVVDGVCGMEGQLSGVGCCDANGDNWYCVDDGMEGGIIVMEDCP